MLIISMYGYVRLSIPSHDLCPDVHLGLGLVVALWVLNGWSGVCVDGGVWRDVLDVYACILMDARASGCRLEEGGWDSTPSFLPLTTNSSSSPSSSSSCLQSTLTTAIDCCQFHLPFLPFIHSCPDGSVCDGFSTATVFTHPIMYVFTFNHLDQSIMCLFRH